MTRLVFLHRDADSMAVALVGSWLHPYDTYLDVLGRDGLLLFIESLRAVPGVTRVIVNDPCLIPPLRGYIDYVVHVLSPWTGRDDLFPTTRVRLYATSVLERLGQNVSSLSFRPLPGDFQIGEEWRTWLTD